MRTNRALFRVGRLPASVAALLSLAASAAAAQPETNDHLGFHMARGDFNGDGYDDLVLSAMSETIGSNNLPGGAVDVHYGPNSAAVQTWHQDVTGISGVVEAGDAFGHGLAVGDFDNDGFDDLAIAAPWEEVDGQGQAGMVHVLYGSLIGLSATDSDSFHQNSSGIAGSCQEGDYFGFALAAGDFGKDGADDLAIGIPGEAVGTIRPGAVAVLYGATDVGLSSTGSQLWHQNSSGIDGVAEEAEDFGRALAAGNFGEDGKKDLAIGIPYESVGSAGGAGAIEVIFGSTNGLTSTNDQLIHQDSSFVPDIAESGDHFGFPLAVGRFNTDSYDDLVIGVPWEDVYAIDDGLVHVMHGGPSGFATAQFSWTTAGDVPGDPESGDYFGLGLGTGDFNDDGRDDLAIGAYLEDVNGVVDAGAVTVLYSLNANGGMLASFNSQGWHQDSAGIEHTLGTNDQFGMAVCGGDFDGDGVADLAVGVAFDNVNGIDNAGLVNIIEGRASTGLTGDQGRIITQ